MHVGTGRSKHVHLTLQTAGDSALAAWRARLAYYVYEAVGAARIADMFDIVVDFPDRQVGVEGC